MKILAAMILLVGAAVAQCSQGTPGTNCNSPMTVSGSTAAQSSVGLTDNGAAPPAPAPSQYWLSISNGTIRVSANGKPYALPGMPWNYVLMAQAGGTYSHKLAAGAAANTPALAQIDMTLPQQVRLVVSNAAANPQCTVQAQYYSGGAWNNLGDPVTLTNSAVYAAGWTAMPSGGNGDHQVRLAISNSGTQTVTVSLRTAMLQFK